MKHQYAFLFLFLSFFPRAHAQSAADRLAYLQRNAVIVRNVEPNNEDYSDLAPLKQSLQQMTVIGLGEPIHYDGSTFKAKTRLVKFLHQELGFSVIAFESGFYDCYKAWQQIQAGTVTIDAARKSLYPFWISTETEELFKYIDKQKNTDNPLILAGIDCKFSGTYSDKDLLPDLKKYLQSVGSGVVRDTAKWSAFSAGFARAIHISDYATKPSPTDTLVLNTTLKSILAEWQAPGVTFGPVQSEQLFWQQFCRSSLAEIARKSSRSAEQMRDRQMGNNLDFLQHELYRNRKVMVWAASSHLTYNGANIGRKFYHQNPRLGDYLKQVYGQQYYHIGFTGYKGQFGKLLFFHVLNVKKHHPNSIEHLLGKASHPFMFIDFHKSTLPQWLQASLVAMPFGYRETAMRLPFVMDGLFYTKEVFQSHWISVPATPR